MSLRLRFILLSLSHYSAWRLFICITLGWVSKQHACVHPKPRSNTEYTLGSTGSRHGIEQNIMSIPQHAGRVHTHMYNTLQMVHLCSCFHAGLGMPLRLCCKLLSMRLCVHVGLLVCHGLRLQDAIDLSSGSPLSELLSARGMSVQVHIPIHTRQYANSHLQILCLSCLLQTVSHGMKALCLRLGLNLLRLCVGLVTPRLQIFCMSLCLTCASLHGKCIIDYDSYRKTPRGTHASVVTVPEREEACYSP